MRKVALLAVPAVTAMVVVAWLMNDTSFASLLSDHRHEPLTYGVKQTIHLTLALAAAGAITMAVSIAGSIVRMAMRLGGYRHDQPEWKRFSAEGAIIGLVVVGVWLGWSPRDVYPHPDDQRQFVIRRPSLLENPLGFPPGSQGLSTLIVTYRDTKGNILVQKDYEFTDGTATERVGKRTILWGAKGTQRPVVQLANDICLFFPEPMEFEDGCPPESVIKTYLSGETVDGRKDRSGR